MTMRKPIMYFESDKNLVHCEAPHGSDYTLCGFTLDGDQGEIVEAVGPNLKITCGDCLEIIRFCRDVSLRSLDRQRAARGYGELARPGDCNNS